MAAFYLNLPLVDDANNPISGAVYALEKRNVSATTDPGVNDDTTQGYRVGSGWDNVSGKKAWICTDDTTGAAMWVQVATGGGGPPTGSAGGVLAGTYPNPDMSVSGVLYSQVFGF